MLDRFSFWQQRSQRERRIIAVAFLIAVVFIGVNYVFDPLHSKYTNNTLMLTEKGKLLQQYEHLIQTQDKARKRLFDTRAMESGIEGILLTRQTPDLANAELQGLVKELAQKADLSFSRINPQKSNEEAGYVEISLSLPAVMASIKQIQQFLYEVESAPQLLRIKKLEVKRVRRGRNKDQLNFEMEIAGYIRAPHSEGGDESGDEEDGSRA